MSERQPPLAWVGLSFKAYGHTVRFIKSFLRRLRCRRHKEQPPDLLL